MPKRTIPPLVSERVRLRLLQPPDLPMTLTWRNQDHIRKWFVHSEVLTWEQHRRWCAQYFERDDDFIFIIEEPHELQRPVGQISLYNIDWAQQRAEYGRLMIGDAAAAGKGLAKAATVLLLDFGFHSLGLMEIYLEVFCDNAPAIAIYRACGFADISHDQTLQKMSIHASP
ncbi:MAG: GNAT family N-acetyltransferase [Candidatus Binatia bacterium]